LRILLDTHLLLWWLEASPSFSAQAKEMILDLENTVFVRAVSLWENLAQAKLGQIAVVGRLHREAGRRILREPAIDVLADPGRYPLGGVYTSPDPILVNGVLTQLICDNFTQVIASGTWTATEYFLTGAGQAWQVQGRGSAGAL